MCSYLSGSKMIADVFIDTPGHLKEYWNMPKKGHSNSIVSECRDLQTNVDGRKLSLFICGESKGIDLDREYFPRFRRSFIL